MEMPLISALAGKHRSARNEKQDSYLSVRRSFRIFDFFVFCRRIILSRGRASATAILTVREWKCCESVAYTRVYFVSFSVLFA
jgi:hypothetical protein